MCVAEINTVFTHFLFNKTKFYFMILFSSEKPWKNTHLMFRFENTEYWILVGGEREEIIQIALF